MKRRRFLLLTGAAVATGAIAWRRAALPPWSVQAMIRHLTDLRDRPLSTTGEWRPFRVFSHLAQSVEYSMTGYPDTRSPLFRQTAGRLAFFAFSTAGAMSHDLAAPIPGAPAIPQDGVTPAAVDRLVVALDAFESFEGPLQPHFAYGVLSRADYRAAHIMHIRNHLDEFPLS